MSLINKLFETGKKTILKTTLACSLIPFIITGCGDSGDSDKKDKPVEYAPVMEAQANGAILENQEFYRDANATDANGDALTYYLVDSPTGANIDPVTGETTWTPDDSQSNQNHNFTIGVTDGGLSDEKSFSVYVTNTTTAGGNVGAFPTGTAIEGIKISLDNVVNGTFITWTDASGNWEIQNLPDGDYDTMIKDDNGIPVYDTYVPGTFQSMKSKEVSGEITRNCRMSKIEDRGFLNDVERLNGDLRRWSVKPKFKIYTIENHYGTSVSAEKITEIKDVIKTELSQFCQDTYDFADADIEIDSGSYPGGEPDEGYIEIYFNDYNFASGEGGNICYFNTDKSIKKARITLNTSLSKPVTLQEGTEGVTGSGETSDPSYNDSAFYDDGTPATATSYSQEDLETSQRHYKKEFQRQIKNTDFGDADKHDYDPGHDINDVTWNWDWDN